MIWHTWLVPGIKRDQAVACLDQKWHCRHCRRPWDWLIFSMVITTRCCPVVFFYLYLSLPPSLPLSLSRFASRLTIRLVYSDQSRMNGGDQPKTKVGGNIIWAWEDSSAFLLGGAGSPTAVARGRVATCQTTHPRRRPRVMEGRRRLVNKWVSGSHSQAIRLIVGL